MRQPWKPHRANGASLKGEGRKPGVTLEDKLTMSQLSNPAI